MHITNSQERSIAEDVGLRFPVIYRAVFWLGFFYVTYFGKRDESSELECVYQECIGTHLMAYAEKKILRYIEKCGYQKQQDFESLPVLHGDRLDIRKVRELTYKQVPFVIKGGARYWRAVQELSPDFFDEHYGDKWIPANQAKNKPSSDTSKPTPSKNYYDIKYTRVKDLVESVKNDSNVAALSVEDILHHNDDYLIKEFMDKEYIHHLSGYNAKFRSFLQRKLRVGMIGSFQMFMHPKSGYTTWHCAPADNFFVQVYGKKQWTFVHPKYSVAMGVIAKNHAVYQGSRIDARESHDAIERRGFKIYPYVPKYRVTLEPGDLLFNPNYWWHTVRTSGDLPTIGLGIRTVARMSTLSLAFKLLRILDWRTYRIIKKSATHGRLYDDDLVNSIFEFADPGNKLNANTPD